MDIPGRIQVSCMLIITSLVVEKGEMVSCDKFRPLSHSNYNSRCGKTSPLHLEELG